MPRESSRRAAATATPGQPVRTQAAAAAAAATTSASLTTPLAALDGTVGGSGSASAVCAAGELGMRRRVLPRREEEPARLSRGLGGLPLAARSMVVSIPAAKQERRAACHSMKVRAGRKKALLVLQDSVRPFTLHC